MDNRLDLGNIRRIYQTEVVGHGDVDWHTLVEFYAPVDGYYTYCSCGEKWG